MAKNQLADLASLNARNIVEQLFSQLNTREQDVLTRRFGLHGLDKETLEGIGREHKLTRERIRQIETGSIKKLKKSQDLEAAVGKLKQIINLLLEEHGGLLSKEHLFSLLSKVAHDNQGQDNYLDFLLSKVLDQDIDSISNSTYFNESFKLKYQSLTHLEEVAKELLSTIKDKKDLLATEELINQIKQLAAYQSYKDKFAVPNNLDLSGFTDEQITDQDRAIVAFLKALSEISQNKFGLWGHCQWREITPKTINDKIYLVLKNHGQPMYYGDIAQKISELGFDHKKVNTATTHNELILDDKYILVGRGLYGLKEWGYKNGTVADVIEDILKEAGQPLTKQEITDQVLAQRLVKQTTINLALMNKNRFAKVNGRYQLINQQ